MSHVRRSIPFAVILLAVAACTDTDRPLAPESPDLARAPAWQEPTDPDRLRDQRLARRFALALKNPVFRAEVLRALDGSGQREGRVHLQRFLNRGVGLARMAAGSGVPAAEIRADLDASPAMEVYLPVPRHRAEWRGGTNVLVATARVDGEAPVAFDLEGRQRILDPRTPPGEPVIALQTWEGKDEPNCDDTVTKECSGSDEGGGSDPEDPTSPPTAAPGGGLFLTETRFFDTFEGWLKGAPEFEIHVLGHKSGTEEMVSYQCIGEQAGGPYSWNQDDLTWSGSVLMFSQSQLDQFDAQHPGQGLRFLVLEDDDGPCEIKVNRDRATDLFKAADKAYDAWTSGKQIKFTDFSKGFVKAKSFYDLISGLASFFKSNDDIVGTAILDPGAADAIRTGANWIVKNDQNIATGALRLEMR
ncbi:MAG TPA: hypothetical protein VMK53_06345 [Gemmatimonadales bacterium]|nr:hypothetical protein [Gemmatimonadales bacterium]